jgi:DNA repair protein RadA/Sms
MEGTRPLLVEIQGLTSESAFGHPRRTANGVDFNRLLLTLAVLDRRVGLGLGTQDVFLNVVGGLRIGEPGADLAVAMAIASSCLDSPIPQDVAFIGEIGLSGEIRAVQQLQPRLKEAVGLGFSRVYVPSSQRSTKDLPRGVEAVPVTTVKEAVEMVLK